MTDAPEQIWAAPSLAKQMDSQTADIMTGEPAVSYTRTDIAQKVRPLVWVETRKEKPHSDPTTLWTGFMGSVIVGVIEEYDEGDVWVDDQDGDFDLVQCDVDVMAKARSTIAARLDAPIAHTAMGGE